MRLICSICEVSDSLGERPKMTCYFGHKKYSDASDQSLLTAFAGHSG